MHVLYEGVVPIELKLMLLEFVRMKYFDMEFLNCRIQNFTEEQTSHNCRIP